MVLIARIRRISKGKTYCHFQHRSTKFELIGSKTPIGGFSWNAAISCIASGLLALFLTLSRAGDPIGRLSFDSLFLFRPAIQITNLIILTMGESTYPALGQTYRDFDRKIHADTLRQLKKDGVELVVFDIFFDGTNASDADFAKGISEHGNVVLGSQWGEVKVPGFGGGKRLDPPEALAEAEGCHLGMVEVLDKPEVVVRRFPREDPTKPSLSWAAATAFGAPLPPIAATRWISFYRPEAIPEIQYEYIKSVEPGFFSGKIVFIGGQHHAKFWDDKPDTFPTATTRWEGGPTAGVAIHATMFLNLIRRDWLTRFPRSAEVLLILAVTLIAAYLLSRVSPMAGIGQAMIGAAIVSSAAVLLYFFAKLWFNWILLAWIQIPAAWAFSALLYTKRVEAEKKTLERKLETLTRDPPTDRATHTEDLPRNADVVVRDFALLKRIGHGSYGDVWLGRSATGAFRAIKVVFRRSFAEDRPFEREFDGVKTFEPISRTHPGLVAILHVAKNDRTGDFHYVMEAADDLRRRQEIDPSSYEPKTMNTFVAERERLSPAECIEIGIHLADALAFLHERHLLHRDVKPSNIIFVNGLPKLADIGLVAPDGQPHSFVGTEGFIPPEGPCSFLADIFALGRVLFQALTGQDPAKYGISQPPIELAEQTPEFKAALSVINQACAYYARDRFQTATELRAALILLREQQIPAIVAESF